MNNFVRTKSIGSALFIAVCLLTFGLWSCNTKAPETEESTTENTEINIPDDPSKSDVGELNEETANLVLNIPPPIKVIKVLKSSGATYDEKLPHTYSNLSKYQSSDKQALNMGVYSVDLAYASVFNKQEQSLKLLEAVRRLSEHIGIKDVFTKEQQTNLNNNRDNSDSIEKILTESFTDVCDQLQKVKQEDKLSLMMAGGWIETAYLATQIWNSTHKAELKERISEQKNSLDDILQLLKPHTNNEPFTKLFGSLSEIKAVFAGNDNQSVSPESKGHDTSTVISDQQVKQLSEHIVEIRAYIIK